MTRSVLLGADDEMGSRSRRSGRLGTSCGEIVSFAKHCTGGYRIYLGSVRRLLCLPWLILNRYCFVITPVNYPLAAVNFFVGTTGLVQLLRIA